MILIYIEKRIEAYFSTSLIDYIFQSSFIYKIIYYLLENDDSWYAIHMPILMTISLIPICSFVSDSYQYLFLPNYNRRSKLHDQKWNCDHIICKRLQTLNLRVEEDMREGDIFCWVHENMKVMIWNRYHLVLNNPKIKISIRSHSTHLYQTPVSSLLFQATIQRSRMIVFETNHSQRLLSGRCYLWWGS